MPRSLTTTTLVALAFVLAACGGGDPDLDIGEAQAAEPVSGSSQIVLEISNEGDGDDRLDEVTSPAAIGVEIHRTEIEDGRATMAELDGIDVPAGDAVRFRPGDLHLMLVVPDETVRVGGTFDLTLSFDRSGEVTVPVDVVDLLDLAESEEDVELLDPDAVDPDGDGAGGDGAGDGSDDGADGEVEDDDA